MRSVLVLVAVAGLAMVGCGVTEKSLVGTWEPSFEVSGDEGSDSFASRFANGAAQIADTELELRADNTCTLSNFGLGVEGTWELTDGEVKILNEAGDVSMNFTVSDDGTELQSVGSGTRLVFSKSED